MKPVLSPTGLSVTNDKNFTSLRECLDGGVSLDNFKGYVISGKTDETPDTEKLFIHSMAPQPVGWLPLVGDVYVQAINSKSVDVRATKPNVTFKIFLIQGTQITSEIAVPASDTLSTTQWANTLIDTAAATPTAQTNPLAVTPVIITASAAQGMALVNISCAVADDSYIYCTEDKTSGAGDIYRISRSTGISDKLNVSANPVGALYLDGANLWTCENNTSNPTTFRVDTSTFTLAQTRAGLGDAAFARVARIYLDGQFLYGAGRSTTGTDRGVTFRFDKNTGASQTSVSMTSSGAVAVSGGKDIINDGTNVWLTETAGGVNTILWKSSTANFNVTDRVSYTYGSGNSRFLAAIRMINGSIYGPIANVSEGSTAGTTVGIYGPSMLRFDPNTTTFSEFPLILCQQPGASMISSWMLKCLVANNGFLYVINSLSSLGCEIVQFDTTDNSQTVGWFPAGVAQPVTISSMHGAMIPDTDGNPIILLGNRSTRTNFVFFKPKFPTM